MYRRLNSPCSFVGCPDDEIDPKTYVFVERSLYSVGWVACKHEKTQWSSRLLAKREIFKVLSDVILRAFDQILIP